MDQPILNRLLDEQFGAAIAMLRNAIAVFPSDEWDDARQYWYLAHHCLFFLDFYLTTDANDFAPKFGEDEWEGRAPDPRPSKAALLTYTDLLAARCSTRVRGLTAEASVAEWTNVSKTRHFPTFELMLYNMRHVQHHAAQINLLLRQDGVPPPDWVSRASGDE